MATVASRDLRNHTSDVLRRVAAGELVTVTVNGRDVAEITAVRSAKRSSFSRNELAELWDGRQADPALRAELAELVGDTTDDLDEGARAVR